MTLIASCFQAIIPLALVVGPVLLSIGELFVKAQSSHGAELTTFSVIFFPLLNSLSTLVFIR
jgi:hypothetical protein